MSAMNFVWIIRGNHLWLLWALILKKITLKVAIRKYIFVGGEQVRPYWDKYFGGAEGVIFVVDSSGNDEDLQVTNNELHKALADPELDNLPLMVLCNFSDKEGAKTKEEVNSYYTLTLL
jgi:signal recognition particle receptor subunit beta